MQEISFASVSPIDGGRAMLVIGGEDAQHSVTWTTQIVRPGSKTKQGPDMRMSVGGPCSTELPGERIFITGGGRRTQPGGSDVAEILHLQSGEWQDVGRLNNARMYHTCTSVWVNQHGTAGDIFNKGVVTNTSVLSVAVAGGNYF